MGNETPDFRKGGRPKKFDLDRRTKLIAARVRPDELVAIEGRAAASNLPLSEFVREQALAGAILVRTFRTLSAIDRHDLARIGSNLNQIARRLQHDRRYLSRAEHRGVAGRAAGASRASRRSSGAAPMNWAKGRRTRGRGTSFKGALQYVLHDKGADTAERVGFIELRNLATDQPHGTWREMMALCDAADDLKKRAGVKATGRKMTKPVYAFTLNWHEADRPDADHMRQTALSALRALGMENLQAVIVEHTDRPHRHVHVIVNLIDPDTGKAAPLSNDAHKLDRWADDYEVAQGVIRSPDRTRKIPCPRQRPSTAEASCAGVAGGVGGNPPASLRAAAATRGGDQDRICGQGRRHQRTTPVRAGGANHRGRGALEDQSRRQQGYP